MKLKRFFQVFAILAIVLTIFPFLAADYWWIRIFDFPHVQLTILTATAFILYLVRFNIRKTKDYVFVVALIACLLVQVIKIYPYTPLKDTEIKNSTITESGLRLMTTNVLQKNNQYQKTLQEINSLDPDIVVLDETDKKWEQSVMPNLNKDYPYHISVPLSNTYGVMLFSKLKLINPQVNYMVEDSIPSLEAKFIYRKDTIQLYSIHPTPPFPDQNLSSADRDAEIMKIAFKARKSNYPVVVLGDFNDVAWSETTVLFRKIGRLLDLRIGRGFYNTFNANNFIMRWPLDHIFVSPEFRVKQIKVGSDIGSDHFPAFAELTYEPDNTIIQEPGSPTKEELQNARLQIEDEVKEDQENKE
ncbi:endonuclease/exonuclease/phosphatase family protein [Zunongwangia sp.]|uniref:endonuclease/exonuclease/phosphatase family protein n=1 Tax=Zunongwangia sp. TaxID=1965325 RepID=UPI003AA81817